jgi:hypothetical protein
VAMYVTRRVARLVVRAVTRAVVRVGWSSFLTLY